MPDSVESLQLFVLTAYSVVLVAAILLGANLGKIFELTHTRTQLIMSFVSGLMLGIAIFHLLPHALYTISDHGSIEVVSLWLMVGLLTMFMLLRVFHFHHHDLADDAHDAHCVEGDKPVEHSHPGEVSKNSQLSWVGVALGLTLHTIVDGVALAASIHADAMFLDHVGGLASMLGFGVFIAVLLHKPLDALTISAVMNKAGSSARLRWLVMTVFALICPLTAALMLWGFGDTVTANSTYIGAALAFSAGVFLCISLSDLLPEVHFHSHDRIKMTVVLLLGIGFAYAISYVEPEHRHQMQANVVIVE